MFGVRPGLGTHPYADGLPHRSGGSLSGRVQSTLPGWGATVRILFESRPLFPVTPGATNRAVMEGHGGVGFLWVRE